MQAQCREISVDESLNGIAQIVMGDFIHLTAMNDIHGMEPESPFEIFFGIHIAIVEIAPMILLRVHTIDGYICMIAERNIKTSVSHDVILLVLSSKFFSG